MQIEQLRTIVQERRPDTAIRLLAALGWDGANSAGIERPPDAPSDYARLSIQSGATAAGTQLTADRSLWWTGFQQGALYHVSVSDGEVEWLDFEKRLHWRAKSDGDLRPLWGLSADFFRKTGVFAPKTTETPVADFLPKEPPRPYLTSLIRRWWWTYVGEAAPSKADGPLMENKFVRLIARLVFIRTIEDTRRAAWLKWGTLRDLASDAKTVNSGLTSLFKKLNTRLQSQIFTGPSLELPSPSLTRELIGSLYRSHDRDLNFSAIDFHMIGRFWEAVLGEHLAVRETGQFTIWGSAEREVVPVSHRREHGQYYTPRAYSDYLAQKAVLPRVLAAACVAELPVVADIAVGSGELLTAAFRQMLSVPRFRTAEAVREILKSKFVGFDNHATAVHLAQLNLLRTAYLVCPELVEHGLPLPSVEGLDTRDTLDSTNRDRMGVDVVVANPPFRGLSDWLQTLQPAVRRSGMMSLVSGNSNRATAFLIRAVELVRDGGTIGIVMPNQFFVNTGNAKVRAALAKELVVEEVVLNHGAEVFTGVKVQPGILFARKRPRVRSPGMILRTLAPPKILARSIIRTGLPGAPGMHVRIDPPPDSADWIWVAASFNRTYGDTLQTATKVLGSAFSRAPIPDRTPMKDVWSLQRAGNTWKNAFGSLNVDDVSACVVVPVRPSRLPTRQPLGILALPSLEASRERLLYPYIIAPDGRGTTATTTEWRDQSEELGDLMSNVAEAARSRLKVKNKDYELFRRHLGSGVPEYFRLMRFRAGRPFILMSRMAQVRDGEQRWPYWVFPANCGVVPVDGLFLRVADDAQGLAFGALLNTDEVIDQLRRRASATGPGKVEVSPRVASALLLPDLKREPIARRWRACLAAGLAVLEARGAAAEVDALDAAAKSLWEVRP